MKAQIEMICPDSKHMGTKVTQKGGRLWKTFFLSFVFQEVTSGVIMTFGYIRTQFFLKIVACEQTKYQHWLFRGSNGQFPMFDRTRSYQLHEQISLKFYIPIFDHNAARLYVN